MRFQQGVDDKPTRLPISATESEASSCRTVKILRSMASIEIFFQLTAFTTLYIEKYFDQEENAIPAMRPETAENQAAYAPPAPAGTPHPLGSSSPSSGRRCRIRRNRG